MRVVGRVFEVYVVGLLGGRESEFCGWGGGVLVGARGGSVGVRGGGGFQGQRRVCFQGQRRTVFRAQGGEVFKAGHQFLGPKREI